MGYPSNVDAPRLEPEQVELLSEVVAAHRRVPREQRDRFHVVRTMGGTWLHHAALGDWRPVVAASDVEVLVEAGVLNGDWDAKGRVSGFRVTQHTIDVLEALTAPPETDEFLGGDAEHNEPLTEGEILMVVERVERVRTYLVESGVTGAVLAEANAKLDYLVGAARRVGRFDWWNIAVSTLIGIAVSAAFDPDRAQVLFRTILGEAVRLLGP